MITATLNLYILSFNKITLEYDVLSLDPTAFRPPSEKLDGTKSLDSIVCKLIENHIEISSSFINYKLSDAEVINNELILSYYCFIPFNTNINNCFSFSLNNHAINCKNLKKIISAL